MNSLVPLQAWIPAPPPVRVPPPVFWILPVPPPVGARPPVRATAPALWAPSPFGTLRPQLQVWTPLGWVPAARTEFPPGTRIRITTPVTMTSGEPVDARVRVGIFEGSILPERGTLIATITSAWLRIARGQTLNFPVEHTTVERPGVERRDVNVEVQYLLAGRTESGGSLEWDDLFWVAAPVYTFQIGTPTVTRAT